MLSEVTRQPRTLVPLRFWFYRLTSHLCIIAKRAGLVNPVLLQQLLIPGTTVQRVSKTQELPGGKDEQSVNKNKQMEKSRTKMLLCPFVGLLLMSWWLVTKPILDIRRYLTRGLLFKMKQKENNKWCRLHFKNLIYRKNFSCLLRASDGWNQTYNNKEAERDWQHKERGYTGKEDRKLTDSYG